MKTLKISDWLWVLYPLAVVASIFGGLAILFGDGGQRIAKIGVAQQDLATQKAELARLEQKERLLSAVDIDRETATLMRLTKSMPATKKVWLLVSELSAAGEQSGAPLTGLSGVIGDVKEASDAAIPVPTVAVGMTENLNIEATYAISDWTQIKSILALLSKSIPLVTINDLTYNDDELLLVVEGAWKNWSRITAEASNPLPDITTEVAEVEARLADFVQLAESGSAAGEFIQTANPF